MAIEYIIQKSDIGKTENNVRVNGVRVQFESMMGRVQPGDVGKKMVYNQVGQFWQVENDEQYRQRQRRTVANKKR